MIFPSPLTNILGPTNSTASKFNQSSPTQVEHGCSVASIGGARGGLVVGGATGDDLVEFLDWETRDRSGKKIQLVLRSECFLSCLWKSTQINWMNPATSESRETWRKLGRLNRGRGMGSGSVELLFFLLGAFTIFDGFKVLGDIRIECLSFWHSIVFMWTNALLIGKDSQEPCDLPSLLEEHATCSTFRREQVHAFWIYGSSSYQGWNKAVYDCDKDPYPQVQILRFAATLYAYKVRR